jgi:hypothetical protein
MIRCPGCDAATPTNTVRCPLCNALIGPPTAAPTRPSPSGGFPVGLVVVGLAMVAVLGAGVAFFGGAFGSAGGNRLPPPTRKADIRVTRPESNSEPGRRRADTRVTREGTRTGETVYPRERAPADTEAYVTWLRRFQGLHGAQRTAYKKTFEETLPYQIRTFYPHLITQGEATIRALLAEPDGQLPPVAGRLVNALKRMADDSARVVTALDAVKPPAECAPVHAAYREYCAFLADVDAEVAPRVATLYEGLRHVDPGTRYRARQWQAARAKADEQRATRNNVEKLHEHRQRFRDAINAVAKRYESIQSCGTGLSD